MAILVIGLVLAGLSLVPLLADRLRQPLAAALAEQLGLEVRISQIHLGLAGLVPRLSVEGLDLMRAGDPEPQVHLPALHLDLDTLASLAALSPRVAQVTLEGPRLRLEQQPDGRVTLAGLALDRDGAMPPAPASFLAHGRLLLRDAEIEWLDRRSASVAAPLILREVQVEIHNQGYEHRLELQARFADDPDARLRLSAQLGGEEANPWDLSGTLNFSAEASDPSHLLAGRLPEGWRVAGDHLALEGRYRLQHAMLVEGRGRLGVTGPQIQGQIPEQGPFDLAAARLDLQFTHEVADGRLEVDGEGLVLSMPGVFGDRPPIHIDRLAGPLIWSRDPLGAWHLTSHEIQARNADLDLRLGFALQAPPRSRAEDLDLDLEAAITQANAAAIRDYLPDAKLNPRARAWLDRAFPGGQVAEGRVLFMGRLGDFPFHQDQGYFHVLLWVRDMALNFHPDWPALAGLSGAVHFHNQGLSIATRGGDILGFPLVEAQAEIPDLADARFIRIRGLARGDFKQALAFPGQTPLKKVLRGIPALFTATGQVRVDLDMDIPLSHDHPEDQVRLAGALSWPGATTLTLGGTGLGLRDLKGALSFSEGGLTYSHLDALFLDVSLRLDLEPVADNPVSGHQTRIRLESSTAVRKLADPLPNPLWRHLEGETPWEMSILISDQSPSKDDLGLQADFTLTSNLDGLRVKLPPPLGKTAQDKRALNLSWRVAAKEPLQVRGRYGDLALNLLLRAAGQGGSGFSRGALAFGQERTDLPAEEGLRLSGHLPELDLQAWLDWGANPDSLRQRSAAPALPDLIASDLRIDRMQLAQLHLHEVRLNLEGDAKAWDVHIQAKGLAGHLNIPRKAGRTQPLRATFGYLDLKSLLKDDNQGTVARSVRRETPATKVDPHQLPDLDLVVDKLDWGGNELGRLTLMARPVEEGLAFDPIHLRGPSQLDLRAKGTWMAADPRPARTRLELEASTADLGELLRHLDYISPVDEAPANAKAELAWAGGPHELALAELEGEITLDIGKGSLVDVEPGVGRVLGVMNLGALGRRLSLDFTDLFDRGFVFESIKGKLGIRAGQMEMLEPLVIEGSSAEVRLEGRANLLAHSLDQVATVTPSLGGSVALASAIAAGPLVGAAVLIADKASGGALDRIGRHAYDIRGPWTNPAIEPRLSLGQAPADSAPPARQDLRDTSQESGKEGPNPATQGKSRGSGNVFLDQP